MNLKTAIAGIVVIGTCAYGFYWLIELTLHLFA